MSRGKKKKGSSRLRPLIPGTSQFARFASAAGPPPSFLGTSGPSVSDSPVVKDSCDGVSPEEPSVPLVPLLSSPDLKSPLAQQVAATLGHSKAAVETVGSGVASLKVEVGPLGQSSSTKSTEKDVPALDKKWSSLLSDTSQLEEIGSPTQHISGVPFVLIPDENIEDAKDEFKDFIFAQFHGNYPEMGRVIGVVNALWARSGPRIFVHNTGPGAFLLRVTNPRTRALLLGRHVWNIAGFPMFVSPWSPDFEPDSPPITSASVTAEFRGVPYLLFNKQSLSRLATAVGKPIALAPETERKETFEVAKVLIRVDLTKDLPSKLILGLSSGREYEIAVTYPWLPPRCEECNAYGHVRNRCKLWLPVPLMNRQRSNRSRSRPRLNRRSRQGRSLVSEWRVKAGPGTQEVSTELAARSAVVEAELGPGVQDQVVAPVELGIEAVESLKGGEVPAVPEGPAAAVVSATLEVSVDVAKSEAEDVGVDGVGKLDVVGSVAGLMVVRDELVPPMHKDSSTDSEGKATSDNQHQPSPELEAPFILVSRRKSGRKVTLSR